MSESEEGLGRDAPPTKKKRENVGIFPKSVYFAF